MKKTRKKKEEWMKMQDLGILFVDDRELVKEGCTSSSLC